MKNSFLTLIFLIQIFVLKAQNFNQQIVTTDIDNFWIAYEKINSTKDTILQEKYLNEYYISKGTEGLKGLIEVRNYTNKELLSWFTKYPKFWNSLKQNTLKVKSLYPKINSNIQKLKKVYPELKPSIIYFGVGAFRTNGTVQGNKLLIGSELSLADKTTLVNELPTWRQPFYKTQNPFYEIPLLCTHEYIHTQQKELVESLLYMCLYEGVAEFVSCKVTGTKSDAPAIEFGKANQKIVIEKFVSDLFLMDNKYNWMWGENRNELKVRDLGYYIGYEICERYYNLSKDKKKAIKELIELDYNNDKEVERIVDLAKLLPKTISELSEDYEKNRPKVVSISPFQNGSKDVKSGVTKITITFSEPLNGINAGIDFGPLGGDFCPKISSGRTWSEDKKSWTIEAELLPNKHYQFLIPNTFRLANGMRLKSYLIDFITTE